MQPIRLPDGQVEGAQGRKRQRGFLGGGLHTVPYGKARATVDRGCAAFLAPNKDECRDPLYYTAQKRWRMAHSISICKVYVEKF